MIHDARGSLPQNRPTTTNRTHATRYGPGEVSRRLALCGLLIDRKRALIFAQAIPCVGADARSLCRDIDALGRLQRASLRLQVLAEWTEPAR